MTPPRTPPGVGPLSWLALPPQTHWVNLNPNEPDRIFDPQFGRTEAGRVLLEADLAMKKSFARAMHPDMPTGAVFSQEFDALYDNRPDGNYCFSFRQEIKPAPAPVRETGDELFILDAPLTIEAVAQHYSGYTPCSEAEPLDPRKQEMYRRIIVPEVVRAINTEPQYAALRRVYLSRVAAEWFRRRSAQHPTAVSRIVDSGTVDPWALNRPWDPRPVFDEMVRSLTQGEFVVQRPKETGGVQWIRVYAFGGVNFSAAPRRNVGAREFRANHPRLARQVHRMPAGLRFVGSSRPQRIRNGRHCWRIARLGARRSTTIRVTAEVLGSARGRVRYAATASAAAAGVAGSTAQRTISVQAGAQPRPGGVTG